MPQDGIAPVHRPADPDGSAAGRRWLAALPDQLDGHRRLLARLLDLCEHEPRAGSLSVGCSLGRGVADELSDVDAAVGVVATRGEALADAVTAVEQAVVDVLPGHGSMVDVLRQHVGSPDRLVRRVFAQFSDGLQLDLAVLAETGIRRGDAAPDFVTLHRVDVRDAECPGSPPAETLPAADAVTAEQVHDWTFLAWIALADTAKYLRRGSAWEAHHRLEQARDSIWVLWAAATGATYPWHGLSQVLDHDPHHLPPRIRATVAGLDLDDLHRAARATAEVLGHVSDRAAAAHAAQLPHDLARHVTARLAAT